MHNLFVFLILDQTPTASNTNSTNASASGQLVPPPLTPGTNKKMTEALQATFASWEKEGHKFNVPKGKFYKINFECVCIIITILTVCYLF